ncbi:hypothetical protein B4N89_34825 [Embleya scabrispora]|uniref:DUF4440 domain-containing protein n=1 Tax=Embleya scabrispora TaxID=159449 RepID=A0A1T3NQS6_9ACTN|nr:nuclear transport factor 2 family protein [Embleya scabrispora]OPC79237.1 hypothetical protein B4N89_34825 [Embleya scabrispora]
MRDDGDGGVGAMAEASAVDTHDGREVVGADLAFFDALVRADGDALDRLLAADFVLVDVMAGSVIPKADLVPLIASRRLEFEAIGADGEEPTVRFFDTTAIVIGRTRMSGRFEGEAFTSRSRYTHVFVTDPAGHAGGWTLVNAQGTRLE